MGYCLISTEAQQRLPLEVFSDNKEAIEFLTINKDTKLVFYSKPLTTEFSFIKEVEEHLDWSDKIHYYAVLSKMNSRSSICVKQQGYNGYLIKPIRPQGLVDVFRDMRQEKVDLETVILEKKGMRANGAEVAEILLVEDNPVNQKLAGKVLRKLGHKVTFADNGLSALETVKKNNFDLIFMDMQMPVMDGLEATRKLRKSGVEIPIVALTANAFISDQEACQEAGMDGFASKPLQRGIIKDLIREHSGKESSKVNMKKLLLVEDDNTSAQVLQFILQKELPNYLIKTAVNGVEACSLIGSFEPHVMILDIDLPDLNGVDVLKFMSEHERYSDIKVVLNSALPEDDERLIEATKFDIYGNLSKSQSKAKLLNVIRSIDN